MQSPIRSLLRVAIIALSLVVLTTALFAARRTAMPVAASPADATVAAQAPAETPTLSAEEEKRFNDAWAQQPRVDLGEPAGTAKVVIVKFNDWLCGGCKQWHETYQPIIDKFQKQSPGSVKLVMKDWPWNNRCNFSMPRPLPGHEGSCEAAVAVRIARERGKDAEMIAWLFGQQNNLIQMRLQSDTAAATAIKAKAETLLGMKAGDFDREFQSRLAAVRQDVSNGAALKVEVTPTYYVNGVKTTAPVNPADGSGGFNLPPEYFEAALRIELKKAGAAK